MFTEMETKKMIRKGYTIAIVWFSTKRAIPAACKRYDPPIINRRWLFLTRSPISPLMNLDTMLAKPVSVMVAAALVGLIPISVRRGMKCTIRADIVPK